LDLFNGYETPPFQPEFNFREHVEIARVARSGEKAGWGAVVLLFFFCQEFPHSERGVCRRIVMVQQPVFHSSTSQAVCASRFPSIVSKPRSKASHRQSDQLEQIPYARFLECKKKDQHWLDVAANLALFFSVSERMVSSIARSAALFPDHNRTAMIHDQL